MKKLLIVGVILLFSGCYFDVGEIKNIKSTIKNNAVTPSTTSVKTSTNTNTKTTTTSSNGIVLNKYYVDARETNPRLEKERYEDYDGNVHTSIPTAYLKFLNNEDVELNYACTGEDMCVTKTTYSVYKENGVTYIKLYEKLGGKHSAEELYFLCSEEGSGYALLKLSGNTLKVISKVQGFVGLDMTETTDYKLYN